MKTLLIVCCIALLIAAIWFLGPFFGFGETRPLLSIESRIIFILLAVLYLVSFWLRWPFFIVAMATLCVLIWVPGPFLLIGEKYPLASVSVRLFIIAFILFIALLYGLWRMLLALKDNPALLDRFIRNKEPAPENNSSEVASVIANAVNYVNKNRSDLSFFQRVILARKPLNVLPWYMILGTEDAGKTSAILGSGQHFPLPEQLIQVGKQGQPTRNCECWFANDAVYIDTAGKYVSEPEQHLSEWRALLRALKKHRPVKAINGAVVAFSAADIMGCSKAELFELASSMRARVDDLRQTLGVRFPVYVLVTKLDQLPGFAEYFRILTEQEREQVWGVTFPYVEAMKASVSELHSQIQKEFALLEQRIERDMIVRQQEEYDNRDRKKMYALPQDFQMLSGLVAKVVHNIFFASRYDETQSYTTLRGIYFSSSHQPVDFSLLSNQSIIRKWSNYVENKTPEVTASLTAQPGDRDFLVNDVSYGRQYFLKQLFSEVIVKDVGLARHNLANESKYRLQRFLGHTLCIALAFILLNGFYHSYHNNGQYLDATDSKVIALDSEVSRFVKTSNDSLLPRLLRLSQHLPEYGVLDVFNPTLEWRYGLYTGTDVVNASDSLYQFFLQRLLLAQIEQQATQALQKAIDSDSSEQVFDRLKLYLQVFGQGVFDRQYMINSIARLWETNGKLQAYEERQIFIAHLTNLFASSDWRRFGQAADDGLVKYARTMLKREDVASRLYGRIKDSLIKDMPADLTLSEMAGTQGSELFSLNNEDSETVIPGIFTRAGYYELFKKKMEPDLMRLEREDAWVTGMDNAGGTEHKAAKPQVKVTGEGVLVNPIQQQILALYLDEYTRHWQTFLRNIRIKTGLLTQDYGNPGVAADIYILRTLAASNSPLANLVQRAVAETTLVEKESRSLLENVSNKGRILNAVEKVSLAWAAMEKKLLREGVDNHFAPLREFVTGSREAISDVSPTASGTGLSKLMGALNEQYTLFVIYNDALKNGGSLTLSDSAQKLSAESQMWPDPVRHLISPLLNAAYGRASRESIAKSNEGIDENLGRICRATLEGRYPFAQSQREVALTDFERFFAAGGLVDEYYKKNLADKVDTSSYPWRYKGDAQDGNAGSLEVFEHAAKIRNVFFQAEGGRKLSLTFDVSVPYMEPTITQLNMNFDGTSVNYIHWPVSPVSLTWPASRRASRISVNATPRTTSGTSAAIFTGPWSLFRWLDNADDVVATDSDETFLVYYLDKRRVDIEISGVTFEGALAVDLLKDFRCPAAS
ncbi:type VI secretion system membrane subunit TssM [Enterobacteriaceae bacterium H20N1]|uniref:Type VI secretion system membrane subunit TssM n=1 Tax=Dryocola boscaweniae TaxID=2925397 RepID=A0A9X3ADU4_9ENTR|nr:type VI secretion system membrane subunit TssM [Dryocola boscaweniae]MCT4703383.1 type VI secretion system membrane subunit TssM [Dryocola boscaweniae]MCT4720551.1 type VI secretion system membrane subunit TssM [Dryocola boscaweniae]